MAKSKDGIETGSFQTSGVDDAVDEPKQRGGDGSAEMSKSKTTNAPSYHFAHKRPMCG